VLVRVDSGLLEGVLVDVEDGVELLKGSDSMLPLLSV
jgi:hypothetical protein